MEMITEIFSFIKPLLMMIAFLLAVKILLFVLDSL